MDSHGLDYNNKCVRDLNVMFSSKKNIQIFPGKVKIKLGSQIVVLEGEPVIFGCLMGHFLESQGDARH